MVAGLGLHMAPSSPGMLNSKQNLQKRLNGYGVSFWGEDNVLELDSTDDCTTLWIHWKSELYILKWWTLSQQKRKNSEHSSQYYRHPHLAYSIHVANWNIIDLVACFKFVIVYNGGRVTALWNLCLVLSLLISLKPK